MDAEDAQLDALADELYDVPPEEFTAARRRAQERARTGGDRALAAAVGRLPRPSTAAWVCNLLARERRAEVEGLVELGGLLREAQESLAGDQLRALDRQRAALLAALTRQAVALARERGHRVSGAVETQVAGTLRAALADPDAGGALLVGRLTTALSYSGLGTTGTRPDLRVVPAPPAARPAAPRRRVRQQEARRREAEAREAEVREAEARRVAEERRRRELDAARRALAEATALAEETAAAAEEEQRRVDALGARRDELREEVAALAGELARAEEAAARVAADLERAERHRATARRAATRAATARDRALERARAVEEGGPAGAG
ncbi:hypothetical protein [Geodermatophilus marinus]|uniref:hypothetical protein n=1 Tax=Geodermatophilus sp. LHW52908 TaxID=2303986 RepID=UPI0013144EEF|nr:hypothetical protein [Geodermatophilus sp. LHW52908]